MTSMNTQKKQLSTKFSSLIMSLVLAAPLAGLTPASAQLFPSQSPSRDSNRNTRVSSRVVIPAGAELPVEFEKDRILVTPEETVPITLLIAADIKDTSRRILIPYGTEVVGQIEPAGSGSRFVAQELVFADGTSQFIYATSDVVTRRETVKRGTDTDDILKGAAIGGAAAAVLGEVFGDINIEEVLGGAALGALGGWLLGRESVELISIDPSRDLDIILESDLALR